MYKIPILKSANAIFSPGMAVQAIVLNIKLKIGASKQPSWHWLVEQAL
jgi:hypothetical protein